MANEPRMVWQSNAHLYILTGVQVPKGGNSAVGQLECRLPGRSGATTSWALIRQAFMSAVDCRIA
jgi:hypothetical protein